HYWTRVRFFKMCHTLVDAVATRHRRRPDRRPAIRWPPLSAYQRGFVGYASVALHSVRPEQEDLRNDRGVAQPADRKRAPLCLPERPRAQAQLGGRGPQRVAVGSDRGE